MSAQSQRPLDGTVALVTGGCTRIGRAIARRLGDAAARVALNLPHTPALVDSVVAEQTNEGADPVGFAADVSDRDQFASTIDGDAVTRWSTAITTTKPLVEFDEPSKDRLWAVNVKGMIWGMQLAAQRLASGGRIITLGSSTTALMLPGYSIYDATKAAVEQLVRIGAHEFGARGITVNAVARGLPPPRPTRRGAAKNWFRGSSPCRHLDDWEFPMRLPPWWPSSPVMTHVGSLVK